MEEENMEEYKQEVTIPVSEYETLKEVYEQAKYLSYKVQVMERVIAKLVEK